MSVEENKTFIRRFYEEVFNKRNLAAIDDFIAPDHVDHTLPAGLPVGPEGTKQAISMTLSGFPDLHITIEDMIAEGDKVVIRFTTHGTQRRTADAILTTREPQDQPRSASLFKKQCQQSLSVYRETLPPLLQLPAA